MASVTGLHLQYRLWIAELNADITALRIFNDYLSGIKPGNSAVDTVNYYKKQFQRLRNDIDDLRHDMHINKMELAAISKKLHPAVRIVEKNINHSSIKERYKLFRKAFDKTKKSFQKFGNRST